MVFRSYDQSFFVNLGAHWTTTDVVFSIDSLAYPVDEPLLVVYYYPYHCSPPSNFIQSLNLIIGKFSFAHLKQNVAYN